MTTVASPSAVTQQPPSPKPAGWLLSPGFDLLFILGVAGLATLSGLVVYADPSLFFPVLLADVWLLGYHHVIATFTRLTFDGESFSENRFLVLGLPWIVLAGVIGLAWAFGSWAISTLYLYWQWWHYTRQSYGIARIYGKKAGVGDFESGVTSRLLYAVAAAGIFYRSIQVEQMTFLTRPVKKLPVLMAEYLRVDFRAAILLTQAVMWLAAAAAVLTFAWWLALQLRHRDEARQRLPLTLYVLSHCFVFLLGYVLLPNIDHGWIAINVWHNAQYLLFVWWYNAKRFESGISPKRFFLSWLSQKSRKHIVCYFAVTLSITTAVYLAVLQVLKLPPLATIATAYIVVFQTLNFHHYIVDSLVWRVRKKKLRTTMGIASA